MQLHNYIDQKDLKFVFDNRVFHTMCTKTNIWIKREVEKNPKFKRNQYTRRCYFDRHSF